MEIGGFNIIDDGGWNLTEELPETDYECIAANVKIPLNYGLGIKATQDGESFTTKQRNHHSKPTVVLDITSWRGISIGAIHFYGKLKIELPSMIKDGTKRYSTSCWYIPMFANNEIKLTHVLEQWEIEKYPEIYKYHQVGSYVNGFYGIETIKMRAKEVMKQVFENGWVLKIEVNT